MRAAKPILRLALEKCAMFQFIRDALGVLKKKNLKKVVLHTYKTEILHGKYQFPSVMFLWTIH